MPLLQGKALGTYAACHLLGAQREAKNVLVIALLILGGKEGGRSKPQWKCGAAVGPAPVRPRPRPGLAPPGPATPPAPAPPHPQHADDVARLVQLHAALCRQDALHRLQDAGCHSDVAADKHVAPLEAQHAVHLGSQLGSQDVLYVGLKGRRG